MMWERWFIKPKLGVTIVVSFGKNGGNDWSIGFMRCQVTRYWKYWDFTLTLFEWVRWYAFLRIYSRTDGGDTR